MRPVYREACSSTAFVSEPGTVPGQHIWIRNIAQTSLSFISRRRHSICSSNVSRSENPDRDSVHSDVFWESGGLEPDSGDKCLLVFICASTAMVQFNSLILKLTDLSVIG